MSAPARKPPAEPNDAFVEYDGRLMPREAPRAPTAEAWAAMTPEQQDEAVAALIASESLEEILEREAMSEGDPHLDAKMDARETLRAYYRRRGRRIYVGAEITVFYPGEKGFTPDVIAVSDVEPGPRNCWMVSRERKGVDLAIEVHYGGDRKKDFVVNVERYASLGIAEYFVYDIKRQHLRGYRLPTARSRAYEPIRPSEGRYRSEVLDLELALEMGRLRFYAGTAELITGDELIGKLTRMVETAQTNADQEQARAEQAMGRLSSALLTILRLRGFAIDDAVEARILGCVDLTVLDRWLARATAIATVDELFLDS